MVFPRAQLPLCMVLCACIALCRADNTLTPGAHGSPVVHAVVRQIEASRIFFSDHQLLRRIAFVESKDGRDRRTYRSGYHGGIWQVDNVAFRSTQDTRAHRSLTAKFDKIRNKFSIDWRQVKWEDLRKPLYSGLAARLFLSNIPSRIPIASDIEAQGQYWKTHYNTAAGAGTVDKFVEDVNALVKKEQPVVATMGKSLKGTLDMGENIHYQYLLPEDGMTVKMCVQDGNIIMYGSTTVTTPNSALHEYNLDVSGHSSKTEVCDNVYVKSSGGRKRNVDSESSLYVTLNGMNESNTFALISTMGNTTAGTSSTYKTTWSPLVMAVITTLVLKTFA